MVTGFVLLCVFCFVNATASPIRMLSISLAPLLISGCILAGSSNMVMLSVRTRGLSCGNERQCRRPSCSACVYCIWNHWDGETSLGSGSLLTFSCHGFIVRMPFLHRNIQGYFIATTKNQSNDTITLHVRINCKSVQNS